MFGGSQEIGGFGSRKDLANETRILDIATQLSAPALAKGPVSLAAGRLRESSFPSEQEGRSGAAGIPRSSKDANHGHSYLSAKRPEACYLASMPGGCQS